MSSIAITRISARPLHIPFVVAFRHASAERSETSSLWAEAVSPSGLRGHGESCPRPYVSGETLEGAGAFVSAHETSLCESVTDLPSLEAWVTARQPVIDANPAAWCAVELAILDLLSRAAGQSVEAFLSRPPIQGRFQYSAVLGDAEPSTFHAMAERFRASGFSDFKVKLSGDLERDRQKLAVLREWPDVRIRVDANNLWNDAVDAVPFLRGLGCRLWAIEEPIAPNQFTELSRISAEVDSRIVLDESFLRRSQLEWLRERPDRWLINLRVSKMGGLLRSLSLADAARASGVGLVIGAQVGETSVLTRAALTVAQAARDIVVAQEGAFGTHLLEHDMCEPVLMFGDAGILDTSRYRGLNEPGFGLSVSQQG